MKPLFDQPTSVYPCTQQDIEQIVELAIQIEVPVYESTKREYKNGKYKFISWGGDYIRRTNYTENNTVTASELIARMHEWAAEQKQEEWQPKRGDWVEVSDSKECWNKRIFLANIEGANNPIVCVNKNREDEFISKGEDFIITQWCFMRPVQPKQLTKSEAIAKLNELTGEEFIIND